jgi:Fic family protein
MELFDPAEMSLDEVTTAMLADLAELAHQVNVIRPLSPEVIRHVKDVLLGERVFSSNAIEGNTLTVRETRQILQAKTFLDVRRKREAQEALNLAEALSKIEQLMEVEDASHHIAQFLRVHEILMSGVNDRIAGVLRNTDVMIMAAKRHPPDSREVSSLLDRTFDLMRANQGIDGLVLSIWVHWAIARIHPFEDGNGRMARLWQDFMLLRARLTIAIVRPQDREAYLDALSQADEGNFNPLTQLICQGVMSTLQSYINAQDEADQLQGWAAVLVGESSARETEKRKLSYLRWRHSVEKVRDAFDRCASLINRGSDRSLEVQIQSYDIIDQATWETLLAGGGARRTWFFRIFFRKQAVSLWYYFFFGKHNWDPADADIGGQGPLVNIMLSRQKPGELLATRLEHLENMPITLREILVRDKSIDRGRFDASTSRVLYDNDKKPVEIAKEFFEEVLLKELI